MSWQRFAARRLPLLVAEDRSRKRQKPSPESLVRVPLVGSSGVDGDECAQAGDGDGRDPGQCVVSADHGSPLAFCTYGPWRPSIRKTCQPLLGREGWRALPPGTRKNPPPVIDGETPSWRSWCNLLAAIASRSSGSPVSRLTKPRPTSGEGGGSGAGDQGWGSCRHELIVSEQITDPPVEPSCVYRVNDTGCEPVPVELLASTATALMGRVRGFGNGRCGLGAVGVSASVTRTRRVRRGGRVAGSDARAAAGFRVPCSRSCPDRLSRFPLYRFGCRPGQPGEGEHRQGGVGVPGR